MADFWFGLWVESSCPCLHIFVVLISVASATQFDTYVAFKVLFSSPLMGFSEIFVGEALYPQLSFGDVNLATGLMYRSQPIGIEKFCELVDDRFT